MSLFIDKHGLNQYKSDNRIANVLNDDIRLLNLSEFIIFYQGNNTSSMKKRKRLDTIDDIMPMLVKTVCVNSTGMRIIRGTIGENYGREILSENPFDLLVAINIRLTTTNPLDNVLGFVLAELGECTRKPNVWCVKLICVRKIEGITIKSNILLGAFLYCINNSSYPKEAILELAMGYNNMSGFISYTKMGFDKDLKLFNKKDCFSELDNLPMRVGNISNNDLIISRATDGERRIVSPDEDDSGLYNIGKIDDADTRRIELQNQLIICNNLLYRIELAFDSIYENPSILEDQNLEYLYKNWLGKSVRSNKEKTIHALKSMRNDILIKLNNNNCIKECINYICRCIGYKGGKYRTRKSYRKHHIKTRKNSFKKMYKK